MDIHIDHVLTTQMIESFSYRERQEWQKEEFPPVVRDLFQISGVSQITLHAYSVGITKGEVFDWDEIVPKAISALLVNFDPTGSALMMKPPKHHRPPTPEEIEEMEEGMRDIDRIFRRHSRDFVEDPDTPPFE